MRNPTLRILLFAGLTMAGVRAMQSVDGNARLPPAAHTVADKFYVTDQPPAGLTLTRNLSVKERRENFEALWSVIDTTYAHFKLKSIDWADVGRRYRARLDTLTGDDDFYLLMFQLVNEL